MIVKGVAIIKNGFSLHEAPLTVSLNCEDLKITGIEWAVPVIEHGFFTNYTRTISATKPTVDSVKTIRVQEKVLGTIANEYWLVINDDKNVDYLTGFCNGCCGNNPVMEAVTIPTPIAEESPCGVTTESAAEYTYTEPYPDQADGNEIVFAATFNGAPAAPAPAASYADPAAVLAAVQANYAAAGTWSNVNVDGRLVLKLVTTTVKTGSLTMGLKDAVYCLTVPNLAGSLQVDSIVIGTVPTTTTFPETALNDTIPDAVLYHLQQILGPGIVKVENGGTTYYQYTGVLKPVKLQLDGVDKVSFVAGACF